MIDFEGIPLHEIGGLYVPDICPRKRNDCRSLSLIASESSFFCCGENDGSTREIEQDKYTLCFKNWIVDEMTHNDRRDLTHQMSVIAYALAVIENREAEKEQEILPSYKDLKGILSDD